jgi:hypothetical protein
LVASGVVPYCDGEFDVVVLSLSVTERKMKRIEVKEN